MTVDYASIGIEVNAAFAEVGAQGTITRRGADDISVYPPTPGAEKEYVFTGMFQAINARDRDGTQIRADDVMVVVSRPVRADDGEEIEPMNGDKLSFGGLEDLHIVTVDALAPSGYAVRWKCQCRRGG